MKEINIVFDAINQEIEFLDKFGREYSSQVDSAQERINCLINIKDAITSRLSSCVSHPEKDFPDVVYGWRIKNTNYLNLSLIKPDVNDAIIYKKDDSK